nr:hypothetical protein [uncultured Oscillibacter sp.]
MLGKPHHGWTDIQIGDIRCDGSYLTDIPMDALDAGIYAVEKNAPFTLFVDEEGSEVIICSYYGGTYVIREGGEQEEERLLFFCDVDIRTLLAELTEDILRYMDDWVKWIYDAEYKDEKFFAERKQLLLEKLERLGSLLKRA